MSMLQEQVRRGYLSMRKKLAVLLFLTLISSPAFVQPENFKPGAEPEGFRGIKWGTPISVLENMNQVWEEGDLKYYERKGDVLEIGGAKLNRILYLFWQGKLMEARASILKSYDNAQDELANFKILREICFYKFGKRQKSVLGKEEYSWFGDKTWIRLANEEPGFLRLTLGSTQLSRQKRAYEEQKAKQEEEYKKRLAKEAKGF